jgi:hypothetical protein
MSDQKNITPQPEEGSAEVSEETSHDPYEERQPFLDLPTRFDKWEPWVEVIATFVLALATVATAWSGYQAARWGGEQSLKFNQAGALRTESIRASNKAGQIAQVDIALFSDWINALGSDNEKLATFYQERFRPEFKPVFDAWLATDPQNNPDAPRSPFTMPEYKVSYTVEADQLLEEAENTFAEGTLANQTSDKYILNTVIFASVLFLAGVQTRFKSLYVRLALIAFGLLILVYGIYNLATYPIN